MLQPEENDADALERFHDAPEGGDEAAAPKGQPALQQRQRAPAAVAGSDQEEASGSEGEGAESDEDLAELAEPEDSEGSDLEADEEADLMPGLHQQQGRRQQQQEQAAAAAAAKAAERWPASKEAYDMHKR